MQKGILTLAGRALVGGTLMGLANLVPGISGGTMLLAVGLYPVFVGALADLTRFKISGRDAVVLGSVVGAAILAILLLAGPVKALVLDHRWVMFSLFIGLTLGGIPLLARMVEAWNWRPILFAVLGFLAMAALAWAQEAEAGTGGLSGSSPFMLALAGAAGASAMILPGVSGGYLLLVLGQYIRILSALDDLKNALGSFDIAAAVGIGLRVVLPVGIGVVVGVLLVGKVLEFLLERHRRMTAAFLLGLLAGAVIGLWPFQDTREPVPGDVLGGVVVTAADIPGIDPEDYPTEVFRPSALQALGALGLIGVGYAATAALAKWGEKKD